MFGSIAKMLAVSTTSLRFVVLLWVWPATQGSFHDSKYVADRDVMVHLFEWRWMDIAAECERFLAPMGYAGVQVSPPTENAIIENQGDENDPERPWYERYQPVSYKLVTRSGNEEEFKEMVDRCNRVGVRIYVDVVINHMAGNLPSGTQGTNGSTFDCAARTFDAVPYGPDDFSDALCPTPSGNIENYGDGQQVRDCKLVGLNDLNHKMMHVRATITAFLNHLLELGVAGFRFDAAKHMWPKELALIYSELNNLSERYFEPNTQPLIFQEVIDLGGEGIRSSEYVGLGRITEFKYGTFLGKIFRHKEKLCYAKSFGEGWGMVNSNDALVFIDNHDNQRGHGGGGEDILNFFTPELYRKAVAFMLAWPYGLKRVMSSYRWQRNFQDGDDLNNWIGPPHDDDFKTLPVEIASDDSCLGDWVCEHRWPEIAQMVQFSIATQNEPVIHWVDNGNHQIAFSRGNRGFFAINNEDGNLAFEVETGLAPGQYCDVTSGIYVDQKCTGRIFTVTSNHMLLLNLSNGMMALHAQAKISDPAPSPSNQIFDGIPSHYRRTVVFVKIPDLYFGHERVFMRGGISSDRVSDCREHANCAIPINHTWITEDEAYETWKTGDTKLDWDGKQSRQKSFQLTEASGTPLFQSSNNVKSDIYHPLNVYGDDILTLDVMMECSRTDAGWFEFKVYQPTDRNPWESDIHQNHECDGGTFQAQVPFNSKNHLAMCGKVNLFTFGESGCRIDDV